MSRGFYMGDSFDRGCHEREDIFNWGTMACCNSLVSDGVATSSYSSATSGISNRLDKIESSLEKLCGGCVNFAANAEEAREGLEKVVNSVKKLGAGVRLTRADLKTLKGRERYYV